MENIMHICVIVTTLIFAFSEITLRRPGCGCPNLWARFTQRDNKKNLVSFALPCFLHQMSPIR